MNINNYILDLADQCVKCGMCLPHCPTYKVTQLESESPRGRIAIIQALIGNKIQNNQAALSHIDNCLSCRACEKICPSQVLYGTLLDKFKTQQHGQLQAPHKRVFKSLIRFVLLNSTLNSWVISSAKLLHLNNLIGLPKQGNKFNRNIYKKNISNYPTTSSSVPIKNNKVGLFVGCTGSTFDRQSLNDIILVLNAIGYDVIISNSTNCCGALDSHAGREQAALESASNNINAFNNSNVDHIVYFATGCGAVLTEYHLLDWSNNDQHDQAQQFTNKLCEVSKFVHEHWPEKLTLKSKPQSIAVHEPCTHRNVLKESDIGTKLLGRINGITLVPLQENKLCCGAAGDYMIMHKKMATTLRAAKLAEISQLKLDLLVTTNVGCALHLRKGLHIENQAVTVVHPVSVIAELISK